MIGVLVFIILIIWFILIYIYIYIIIIKSIASHYSNVGEFEIVLKI